MGCDNQDMLLTRAVGRTEESRDGKTQQTERRQTGASGRDLGSKRRESGSPGGCWLASGGLTLLTQPATGFTFFQNTPLSCIVIPASHYAAGAHTDARVLDGDRDVVARGTPAGLQPVRRPNTE